MAFGRAIAPGWLTGNRESMSFAIPTTTPFTSVKRRARIVMVLTPLQQQHQACPTMRFVKTPLAMPSTTIVDLAIANGFPGEHGESMLTATRMGKLHTFVQSPVACVTNGHSIRYGSKFRCIAHSTIAAQTIQPFSTRNCHSLSVYNSGSLNSAPIDLRNCATGWSSPCSFCAK